MRLKRGRRRLTAAVLTGVLGAAVVSCGPRNPAAAATPGRAGGEHQSPAKADYAGLADVPEQVEPDGTSILVGDPQALTTVHLYEDPRCPYCKEFETTGGGPVLTQYVLRRKVKVEYTMASFLDGRLGGNGSKKAVNALRAAVEERKFAEYHTVLYQSQPPEEVDGFTDARLLQLASKVKGLRSPSFDTAVKSMKYQAFVDSTEKVFSAAGHYNGHAGPGTPTAEVDGYRIPVEYSGLLYKGDLFDRYLARVTRRAAT
ncbi:thioredoxin domain-containing protein [Streptomyces broussonetiae]|uniref:Thioredoxin domain-containing protein n=2 Tax=Streptomyces broussonetiae TaxID=2686304 RepID=A0A6I6NGX0_9ACTN|nr:thioredoxin domain-containing protein [Streptomyces broussonetiae]